jgi:hypothetical protein
MTIKIHNITARIYNIIIIIIHTLQSYCPGIESRWGRFFTPVQTGPGAHPAFCTKGTGYFPGVKRPGRGADHPPFPSAEVENE